MVDEMIPPMTTVANGRCTSAPAAGRDRHGDESEGRNERGHQHRTQPRQRPLPDGVRHGFPAALRHGSEEANWVRRILFQKTFSEWNTLPRCMLSSRNHNFLEKTQ